MRTLRDIYGQAHPAIVSVRRAFPNDNLEGPLLMDPLSYFSQSKKLLVVGQETKGWHCNYEDIEVQLEAYRNFGVGVRYRSSPFWSVTRKLESALGILPHSCAWSNLNRFDLGGGPPSGRILRELSKLDFLISEEIAVLRPDVCIFFTNRKYDDRLRRLFDGLQFEDLGGLPGSHFARLKHPVLPKATFRTPHPGSMRRRKTEMAFVAFVANDQKPNKAPEPTP